MDSKTNSYDLVVGDSKSFMHFEWGRHLSFQSVANASDKQMGISLALNCDNSSDAGSSIA